ncbi:DAK2 domain-containing protein, partial [Streptomyces sp. A7024]
MLDAPAVRTWCALALDALGRSREEIDAINVFPVADGDTGTNLYLTVESAAQAVDAVFTAYDPGAPTPADTLQAMAHGALLGAMGNSGTILAQWLRGASGREAAAGSGADGDALRLAAALEEAATAARAAVAHPVEGTMVTVAAAAAAAARAALPGDVRAAAGRPTGPAGARGTESGGADGTTASADGTTAPGGAPAADTAAVALAAYEGARTALRGTPDQLPALAAAGVVDAGGLGLLTVLGALADALAGEGAATRLTARGNAHEGTATQPKAPPQPQTADDPALAPPPIP